MSATTDVRSVFRLFLSVTYVGYNGSVHNMLAITYPSRNLLRISSIAYLSIRYVGYDGPITYFVYSVPAYGGYNGSVYYISAITYLSITYVGYDGSMTYVGYNGCVDNRQRL